MDDEKDVVLMDTDVKTIYEISKLTSTTKIILDDFNTAVTTLMFSQFLKSLDSKPEKMLDLILDRWERTIILQKEKELETLTCQGETMLDMTLGSELAYSEDMCQFKEDVIGVKDMLKLTITKGLQDE